MEALIPLIFGLLVFLPFWVVGRLCSKAGLALQRKGAAMQGKEFNEPVPRKTVGSR
jgi:hypothetical protein